MAYQLITDSSCDLTKAELAVLGVKCLQIGLVIADRGYPDEAPIPDVDEFYELQLKSGGATTTSGLSQLEIMEAFEPILKAGKDILYVGIDPELSSTTWNNVSFIAGELRRKYPRRRIETPNTHAVAPGLGMIVEEMARLWHEGKDLDVALKRLSYLSLKTAHWFTVDNFYQLTKSGRASNLQALAAGVLNIKPIMRLPYEGSLELVGKVRGGQKILKDYAQKVSETLLEEDGQVWISYGGESQLWRAVTLKSMIEELRPEARVSLHRIGPIIGAHTGETVLAVFFFAIER